MKTLISAALTALLFVTGAHAQSAANGAGFSVTPAPGVPANLVKTGPANVNLGLSYYDFFVGPNAGAADAGASSVGAVGIGAGALQNLTASQEDTAVGQNACQQLTTGSSTTCIGMHSLGFDQTPTAVTAVGNDSIRDAMVAGGLKNLTAIGFHALAHGGSSNFGGAAFGSLSQSGSSNALLLSGTATPGDIISVAITGSAPVGVPVTPTYTVQGGDTLSSIATNLQAAILAQAGISGNGVAIGAVPGSPYAEGDGSFAIGFEFPGSATQGWSLVFTPSVSGAASEIVTSTGGYTGGFNTSFGGDAMQGTAMSSASFSAAFGVFSLQGITTGSANTALGYQSGGNCTTCSNNVFEGSNAGQAITTGGFNIMIGQHTGNTTGTTGSRNILIGPGLQLAAAGTGNTIAIGTSGAPVWSATGTNTPSTSTTTIAGNLTDPGAITFAGVTTGTNADFVCMAAGGVLTLQTSACTISSLRFKDVISELSSDQMVADILALHPLAFKMKTPTEPNADKNYDRPQIGLTAENVAAVDPRLSIYEDDMTTPKSYRQEGVIAALVVTAQTQQHRIEEQRLWLTALSIVVLLLAGSQGVLWRRRT